METKDIMSMAMAFTPFVKIPDETLDNGLNVRCKECNCWVSKRFFLKDGMCPDCRGEAAKFRGTNV